MFKDPDDLIVKLEEHLKHVKDIVDGSTIQSLPYSERLYAIKNEAALMLALIYGAKES